MIPKKEIEAGTRWQNDISRSQGKIINTVKWLYCPQILKSKCNAHQNSKDIFHISRKIF